MEEFGEGLRDLEGIWILHKDQQSQLSWTLGVSQSLNCQQKNIKVLGLSPLPAQMCSLVFIQVHQQLEWGLNLTLLPTCGFCSPNWAALSGLSGKTYTYSSSDLRCQNGWVLSREVHHPRGKGECGKGICEPGSRD